MCDKPSRRDHGWQGWQSLPSPKIRRALGPWVDLSHRLSRSMPRQPFFPEPRFERFMQAPDKPLNVTRIDMIAHLGTHVDSPRHVYNDGPAFEDVPLDRLNGPGVIWPVSADNSGVIGPNELAPALALLDPGDILILNTGFHGTVGTEKYDSHPWLSLDGAQWLIDQRIKLVGVDTPTPDMPHARRPAGFDFPVHRLLLAHGVLIAEHLTNLNGLNSKKVEIVCNALNIHGSDGAPCRIIARECSNA